MQSRESKHRRALSWGLATSCAALLAAAKTTTAPGLDDDVLQKVEANLAGVSNTTDAWVKGTQVEALLELHYPKLTVFASKAADLSKQKSDDVPEVVEAVGSIIQDLPAGQMQLISSDSVGDPCALLPAIVMLSQFKDGDDAQATAVQNQMDALLSSPRSPQGAISHRVEIVQLWADFMYMVPPALSYYGVTHKNETMIEMAINQTLLYRDALATDQGWRHIVMGDWQDMGLWATGNAWAAAGALRVYASIQQSDDYADQYSDELDELSTVTSDILDASWGFRKALTGLLPNYFTGLEGNSTYSMFSDAASTALMSATTYRYAQLGLGDDHIPEAEAARQAIQHSLDNDGWLGNVVNPETWDALCSASESPEAQAFVLLQQAAWQDWKDKVKAKVDKSDKKRRRRRLRFARDVN